MRKEIVGYLAVKEAAKDFETYSSDLLGDRDVRSYRQLPLEADPPRHTKFREAVQPLFLSAAIEPKREQFKALANRLLDEIEVKGSGEVTTELALRYVIGCLTIIYNRPGDLDEWTSWGSDVWTAESNMKSLSNPGEPVEHRRDGAVLQGYLDRVFDAAEAKRDRGGAIEDVWDNLVHLKIDDAPLTRDEMQGIANVLLAGGRDTVIKLITAMVWHLLGNKNDFEFLRDNQSWFNRTVAEMVRFLSPLPKMERALAGQKEKPDSARNPEEYVLLSFVSANHDSSAWENPDLIDIHRERKPHLAFGFGRHSCMGMNITEHEAASFLEVFLSRCADWQIEGEPQIEWATTSGAEGQQIRYLDYFRSLHIKPN